MDKELNDYLEKFVSQKRMQRINSTLEGRTRHITVVLDDIFETQNASAVIRTCECLGIQDIHAIEGRNKFRIHPDITRRSHRWLTVKKYSDPQTCYQGLREAGYRIVAFSPYGTPFKTESLPIDQKAALVFGAEQTGISKETYSAADEVLQIPMYGFCESFNLSVSAAICLSNFVYRLKETRENWQLTPEEKEELKTKWIRNSLRHPDALIRKFRGSTPYGKTS